MASLLISVVGLSNTISRVIAGWLADRPWADSVLIHNVALIIAGLSTCLLSVLNTPVLLFGYAIVFGFSIGEQKISRVSWNKRSKCSFFCILRNLLHNTASTGSSIATGYKILLPPEVVLCSLSEYQRIPEKWDIYADSNVVMIKPHQAMNPYSKMDSKGEPGIWTSPIFNRLLPYVPILGTYDFSWNYEKLKLRKITPSVNG